MNSRRTFLGGAAVALALPWLESLAPRRARAGHGDDAPQRFIAYFAPNGMLGPLWKPQQTGPDFALSPTLAGLAGLEDQITVLSGLDNLASDPNMPGHHAAGTAGFLTAALARHSQTDIHLAQSLDQLFADHLAGRTPLHSLQLGLEGGDAGTGHCDNGFACAYSRCVSWAGPRTPLTKVVSPRMAFDLLFAGYDPEASASERERRRALELSALDSVQADIHALEQRLGQADQTRLEEYLDSVRALELRIEAPAEALAACSLDELPFDPSDPSALDHDPPTATEHAELMAELTVLALRCDLTRAVSFMLGNSASNRSYPELGIVDAHHDLSHHQNDSDDIDDLRAIEAWEVDQLAYLATRLRETPAGAEGNLLDHTLILMSSELSNGNSHTHVDLPVVLAGSGGGAFVTGQHLAMDPGTQYGRLLRTIGTGLGLGAELDADPEAFGGDSAPLPGLLL